MVVRLDAGVLRVDNKINKEIKIEFWMVVMTKANERNEYGDGEKVKDGVGKSTLVKRERVSEIVVLYLLISNNLHIRMKSYYIDK